MPLISSSHSDDGIVSCRMLTTAALESLEDHTHRLQHFDQLQNAYRMLKSYRLGIFGNPQPCGVGQAVLDDDGDDDDDDGSTILLEAFDRAKNAVFSETDITSEDAARILQEGLQQYISVDQPDPDDLEKINKTRDFFEALLRELK